MTRFPILLPLIALLGCAPFPDPGGFPADNGEMPSLLPMDEILAQVPAGRITGSTGETLAARASRLQNRARLMRGPVHDPATRAKLAAAIAAGKA